MARILVVEDDQRIADLLRVFLRREGHEIITVASGEEALRQFGDIQPDLVILDLMLPGIHGREVCRAIRMRHDTPIIMLTALDDERDVVEGLDLGADDYVTKPFKPRELLARVRAALRRASGKAALVKELIVGDLQINTADRTVTANGRPIALRPREFDLLVTLAQRPGSLFTREQLLRLVWDWEIDEETRTVDVHVNRLRQRLAGTKVTIEGVRGLGYRLVVHDTLSADTV
ncbi:response regulator transcription factor [Thermorudis peleae]|uniref:response regulator transcription factor n=1 Tax=Thermorudis peleae TaxID=1382356 RepID=UPI00056DFF70|nr:response regulator transcription factor [Thermorudis peleae]